MLVARTALASAGYLGRALPEPRAAHPLCDRGFHYPPAKEHHYAFAKSRTEIQVSGEANFDVNH